MAHCVNWGGLVHSGMGDLQVVEPKPKIFLQIAAKLSFLCCHPANSVQTSDFAFCQITLVFVISLCLCCFYASQCMAINFDMSPLPCNDIYCL